jgi:peroxiredoxin
MWMNARNWALCLAVAALALGTSAKSGGKCKVALGGPAPALAGRDLGSGQFVDLGQMRGKWVYLDFWASWCKPCMRELPGVVNLHEEMAGRSDFAVMSIALDEESTLGDLREARDRHQVNYPVVCDESGWSSSMVQEWCVEAIPSTFLIDPTGRVVERDLSPGEVKNYIARNAPKAPAQPSYQPKPAALPAGMSAFTAKHRVLRDSPTSGRRGYRDLQVSLPSPAAGGAARYLLVVRADAGAGASSRIRYDLEFASDASRQDFPFSVTIREASGDKTIRLPSGEKSVTTGAAVDFLPGAQISLDSKERRLLFIIPLPPGLSSASYTASIYNGASASFENSLAADIRL